MLDIDKESLDILLVEDNPDDVLLMKQALEENEIKNKLIVLGDGQEALDYLLHVGVYSDIEKYPAPGLVILDLKLPKINGVEVLKIVKSDSKLCTIPIIMLTTSSDELDVRRCYNYGVNSYIVKPTEFPVFSEVISLVTHYWLTMNELPDIFRKKSVSSQN